jgi:hypothetical protein
MALQKKVKWLFTLIVLGNLVIVMMVILGALEPPPTKPLPNPNGYDDFVKAGKLVSDNAGDYPTMKVEQLAALVATNAEALKLVRVGLTHECRAPNDYSTNYTDRLLPELSSIKRLALNLCAEGRLDALQNRTNDAAQCYLDAVRLGQECSRGGVIITKLVGIACEALGRGGLRSLTDTLDARQCREVARTLETIDAQEAPAQEFLDEEKRFAQKTGTIGQKLAALVMYKELQKIKTSFLTKFERNQRERRGLAIDFAARAFELEKGKPPFAVGDLVPEYLKAVPKDPATGTDLALRAK